MSDYGYHGYGQPPPHPVDPNYLMWLAAQQQQRGERAMLFPNDVPARVVAAVVYLRDLTAKTAPVLLPKEEAVGGGYDVRDGQRLEGCEKTAMRAACDALEKYFQGDLVLDPYEAVRHRAGVLNLGPAGNLLPPGGTRMPCPYCEERRARGAGPDPECRVCHGSRVIVIYAAEPDKPGAG